MISGLAILGGLFIAGAIDHILWKSAQQKLDNNAWYIWLALGDNPCPRCLELDGKILQGKNIPAFPTHPACRCGLFEADPEWIIQMTLTGEAINENGVLRFTSSNLTDLKAYGNMQSANKMP